MPIPAKKRKLLVAQALYDLGGKATTQEIAKKLGLHTNGISQTLGTMGEEKVKFVGGKAGKTQWELLDKRTHVNGIAQEV